MRKTAYIIVLSLAFLGYGCGQRTSNGAEGYGANESGLTDDQQTGAGQVDDSRQGQEVSNNGGTMTNTTATDDTLHNLGAVGESEAARATEKTQQRVGNSSNIGETNESKSRTTKNKVIKE